MFTLRQVFDEELDGDRSIVEKTVNLSVADGEEYYIVNDPIDDHSQTALKSKHKPQMVRELQHRTRSRKFQLAHNQALLNLKSRMRPL